MFTSTSKQAWLDKVLIDLKGKSLDTLQWNTDDFTLSPFFHHEDSTPHGSYPSQKADNSWRIGEQLVVQNAKSANQQALAALQKGANALCFELPANFAINELDNLLVNIHLDWIYTTFAGPSAILEKLIPLLPKGPSIDLHATDRPIVCPPHLGIVVDGRQFSASVVRTLAQSIHAGNQLLVNASKAHQVRFWLSIGDQYFLNIAALRALRLLWQQVLTAWKLEGGTHITVEVGTNTHTEDEHYNKIKATAQAMGAVIGGVDQLFLQPSDAKSAAAGTVFSRRIALNVQHLLEQESYLGRVVDPAAGSYFIEDLTNQLAEAAWEEFQRLDETS